MDTSTLKFGDILVSSEKGKGERYRFLCAVGAMVKMRQVSDRFLYAAHLGSLRHEPLGHTLAWYLLSDTPEEAEVNKRALRQSMERVLARDPANRGARAVAVLLNEPKEEGSCGFYPEE